MAEGFVGVVMSFRHVLQKENPQGTLSLGKQLIRGITSICWESMLTPSSCLHLSYALSCLGPLTSTACILKRHPLRADKDRRGQIWTENGSHGTQMGCGHCRLLVGLFVSVYSYLPLLWRRGTNKRLDFKIWS